MGIAILTIEKINGSDARAGAALFNSNRILNDAQLIDTDDTHFTYAKNVNDVVGDKYWVSETLTTADDVYGAVNTTYYTLPIHDDLHDSSSSTTSKPVDADDIAYGVPFGSDTSKCLLWIQSGGKVEKFLVDKSLYAIEDQIMTGSTTTTTSTSTSTTTSTTSTTTP